MKAILLEKPQQFRSIEIAEPALPGPGEALVRVHRIGICGTDYSGYLGKMPFYSYPRIPGHELGVEVLEVGEGVGNVQPGERCSVDLIGRQSKLRHRACQVDAWRRIAIEIPSP